MTLISTDLPVQSPNHPQAAQAIRPASGGFAALVVALGQANQLTGPFASVLQAAPPKPQENGSPIRLGFGAQANPSGTIASPGGQTGSATLFAAGAESRSATALGTKATPVRLQSVQSVPSDGADLPADGALNAPAPDQSPAALPAGTGDLALMESSAVPTGDELDPRLLAIAGNRAGPEATITAAAANGDLIMGAVSTTGIAGGQGRAAPPAAGSAGMPDLRTGAAPIALAAAAGMVGATLSDTARPGRSDLVAMGTGSAGKDPAAEAAASGGADRARAVSQAGAVPNLTTLSGRELGRSVRADSRTDNRALDPTGNVRAAQGSGQAGHGQPPVPPVMSANDMATGQDQRPGAAGQAPTRATGDSAATTEPHIADSLTRNGAQTADPTAPKDFADAMKAARGGAKAGHGQTTGAGSGSGTGTATGTGSAAMSGGEAGPTPGTAQQTLAAQSNPASHATQPAQTAAPIPATGTEAAGRGLFASLPPAGMDPATGNHTGPLSHDADGPRGGGTTGPVGPASAAQGSPRVFPTVPLPHVAVRIAEAAARGEARITLQLIPAKLGRIDVTLDVKDGGKVHATITAERPDTLDSLQRDQRGLERALQQAGLDTDSGSLNFNLREGRQDREDREPDMDADRGGDAGSEPGAEDAAQGAGQVRVRDHVVARPGGLDIEI